jgi:hypothetical protein
LKPKDDHQFDRSAWPPGFKGNYAEALHKRLSHAPLPARLDRHCALEPISSLLPIPIPHRLGRFRRANGSRCATDNCATDNVDGTRPYGFGVGLQRTLAHALPSDAENGEFFA